MSPTSITRLAITNFQMLGSVEPSLINKPTFMSYVPIVHSESPYFLHLTSEFSLHYVQYVLVHTLLLMACYLMGQCFGYCLFVLYHLDCLFTMGRRPLITHPRAKSDTQNVFARAGGRLPRVHVQKVTRKNVFAGAGGRL